MTRKVKLSELLRRLNEEGFCISKETFEYYQDLGILPEPEIKPAGERSRGVYEYDKMSVVLRQIQAMREEGYTPAQIQEMIKGQIFEKYRNVLKKWGFSDYELSELKGITPEEKKGGEKRHRDIMKEVIREHFEKDGKKLSEEVLEILLEYETFDRTFERKISQELLPYWFSDTTIDLHAVKYISNEADHYKHGLITAIAEIATEIDSSKNKAVKKALREIHKKLVRRVGRLQIISANAKARLAEITGKPYDGQTQEQWEETAKRYQEIIESDNKAREKTTT